MQRVGGDARALETSSQFLGVHHVGQLGDGVLGQAGDALGGLAHGLVVDSRCLIVTHARHVDDARRCAGLQLVEQEVREQERAHVVGAERQLEAAFRQAALPGQPGVVDQGMQRLVATEEVLGALTHRLELAEIELEIVGAVAFIVT